MANFLTGAVTRHLQEIAAWEDSHVALAEPLSFAIVGRNEYLTGNDVNCLVLAVPNETSGGCIP